MADIEVDYKGNTIKQIDANTTEPLNTRGTWLEDDLTITSLWNYLGAGAEKISNFADFSVALADTEFNTWTPSTTAKEILATSPFGTFLADMANYDYVVRWKFWTDLKYNAGATLKNIPYKQRSISMHQTYRRSRTYSDFQANISNYNVIPSGGLPSGHIVLFVKRSNRGKPCGVVWLLCDGSTADIIERNGGHANDHDTAADTVREM